MSYIDEMYDMCDVLSRELGEANKKIMSSGGKLSGSDLDYVDKLTHAIKSLKTTIAMMESEGYSGNYAYDGGRSYRGGNSYRGNSYAQRRDSMGRYSRRGYAMDDDMIAELHELMEQAPNEKTRQEFQRFIQKIESM